MRDSTVSRSNSQKESFFDRHPFLSLWIGCIVGVLILSSISGAGLFFSSRESVAIFAGVTTISGVVLSLPGFWAFAHDEKKWSFEYLAWGACSGGLILVLYWIMGTSTRVLVWLSGATLTGGRIDPIIFSAVCVFISFLFSIWNTNRRNRRNERNRWQGSSRPIT